MTDWISIATAADILGINRTTVYRSLSDPEWAARQWGKQGEGWRLKPGTRRKIYQVSRDRAEKLATESSAGKS